MTNPTGSAILRGKLEAIDAAIPSGRSNGMVSFDKSVRTLMLAGKITREWDERNVFELAVLNR